MKLFRHLLLFYLNIYFKNVFISSKIKFPTFFNLKNKKNYKTFEYNNLVKRESRNIFNFIKKNNNKRIKKLKNFINSYYTNFSLSNEKIRKKKKICDIRKCINKKDDNIFSEEKNIKHENKIKTINLDGNYDDFINLVEFGDLSFFYGTNSNRNFYFYENIIKYIKENKNNFININSNEENTKKKTIIDKNFIRIRGRIERKIKQSKRIFLYLRQDYGIYLTCVYEKKLENKNADDLYKYIKTLKNESVVDIIGKIKLHGKLQQIDIPYLESLYNQKSLEIMIFQISCISESFYDIPIMINDNSFLNQNENILNYESIQGKGGKNEVKDIQENEKEDEEEKKNIINYNSSNDDNMNNKIKTMENNNKAGDNEIDKNNINIYENISDNSFINNNEIINTNENILKSHNFCLNYRNSINHIIFNIKSKLSQRLKNLLHKDNYIEVFTSKFIKINKKNQINTTNNTESGENSDIKMVKKKEDINKKNTEKNIIELNGSEGGCNCYKIEKENLLLVQSPQFYKQMLINSDYEKIFEMNYSYRNEKFHTSRHLNEFLSLDIEQVIYDNYYEIIIYMYDILKYLNNYLNDSFCDELNLINLVHKDKKLTFEKSKISKNPIVLSFCEAHELLNKYYLKKNSSENYIYNNTYKKYIKILNKEEKDKLKKKISFESCGNNKLHNVYYYNKIVKKYKINIKHNKNKRDNSSSDIYKFLNNLNKDELYKNILLFFNMIYENVYSKNSSSNNYYYNNTNEVDEKYDMNNNVNHRSINDNIIKCNCSNLNNNTFNSCNKCCNINKEDKEDFRTEVCNYNFLGLLNNFQEKKMCVKQTLADKNLKDKYLFYDDFTNDQLNYLYLFLKYNYETDLFIIDQYPIYIRPYYTLSNMYDLRFTNSFDFIYKGMEIISGSQRINNLPILLFKVLKENKKIDISKYLNITNFTVLGYLNHFQNIISKNSTIHKYFNSFQFSSKPHGGLALGFERYLMSALNLRNIKNAIFHE
ncbi:aspartate--tRNA ligase, putative [Plasmodium gallinaceum]|uniref:Aspartate--tRNA ligase, putative n=1 Tax=Plasmodium gallinaceum TaxID=5849 RepID=A0A1J1GZP5_PLAGA|nr:aspartate--tRNA ligase, putative [Plasmodium gallinaceum]CRG97922.1 aspartate--tRNA ligase, putative [Plasmodium gallinaceum]